MSFYIFLIFLNFIQLLSSVSLCSNNHNFCSKCNNSTNLCEKCEKPEILIPDENGGCKGIKKCIKGKNNCQECDIDGKLCKKCQDNYYSDENGGCSSTSECEISYKGQCIKCKDKYILLGNQTKICKSLLTEEYENCLEFDENGYCISCKEGYELQFGDHKCIKLHHYKESILENSISCLPNYYYNINEKKCLLKENELIYCKKSLDGKKCEECDEGYYFDENGICIESQFCSESINFECTKCIPGYFLSIFKLCTNTDHCYLVDKNNLCTSCVLEYYLNKNDNKCYSNLEESPYKYCKVVNNEECLRCEVGFYFTKNSRCAISKNCEKSEYGTCLQCLENYTLGLDNICTNIEHCIYSDYDYACIECEDGYYYDKLNDKCMEMNDIFLNCKYSCPLGDKCCECKKDYYLNSTDSLCYDNTKEGPFYKCAYVNEEQNCEYCIEDYYLTTFDKKCNKVEGCRIAENADKCIECDGNYCLDLKNQKCIYNDYIFDINDTICFYCVRTNEEGTKCEKCKDGYEASEEGYCVDIDYCEERKDGKCLKCKDIIIDGYYFCSNEIFGCILTYKENCLRCDNIDSIHECTECKEGYIKQGFNCEKIE